MLFHYASGSLSSKLGAKRILAAKYYALGGKNFPAKKLIYIFKKVVFFPPFLSNFLALPDVLSPLTSRRYFSSRYQMSLPPLFADHGTRWTRTEPWVVGPSFCPLHIVFFQFWNFVMNYEVKEF